MQYLLTSKTGVFASRISVDCVDSNLTRMFFSADSGFHFSSKYTRINSGYGKKGLPKLSLYWLNPPGLNYFVHSQTDWSKPDNGF